MKRGFFETKLSKALIMIVILGLFSWWSPSFIIRPIASVAQVVTYPFERFFSFLFFETRDTFSFLGSIGKLKYENERLARENLDLSAENAALGDLRNENETLRRDFGLAPREQYDLLSAEVIGADSVAQGKSFLISRGSESGIAVGMPVIVGKGILIGKVDSIFLGSSRVELLSHPESLIAAMTIEGEAKGIVRGEHGLGILLDLIPRTDTLKKGDSVVTSGLGGEFPRGLLIGTLQDPRYTVDKLFQQASVVPPVKYPDIRFVSVIVSLKQ